MPCSTASKCVYVDNPREHVVETAGLTGEQIQGSSKSLDEVPSLREEARLHAFYGSQERSAEGSQSMVGLSADGSAQPDQGGKVTIRYIRA